MQLMASGKLVRHGLNLKLNRVRKAENEYRFYTKTTTITNSTPRKIRYGGK
jgi:hypothetical protein